MMGMKVNAYYQLHILQGRTFPKTVNTMIGDNSTSLLFDLLPNNVVDNFPPFGPKALTANVMFFWPPTQSSPADTPPFVSFLISIKAASWSR
jgi:hypothetical protein